MKSDRLRSLINWIAIALGVTIAVSIPAIYGVDSYNEQSDKLLLKATFSANRLARFIYSNEAMWTYQTSRLEELIDLPDTVRDINRQRVFDWRGELAIENGPELLWPILTESAPIFIKGAQVGRVEIDKSLRPLITAVLQAMAFSIALALGAYFAVRLLPLRALDRVLLALKTQNARFDAALTNMSHGLCMFDAEKRLVVCNDRYAKMYRLPPELLKVGTPHNAIIAHRVLNGLLKGEKTDGAVQQKISALSELPADARSSRIEELADGRLISVTREPMAGGGWVATHEDITDRARAQAEIAYMAHHDLLTSLGNRAFFMQKIEEASARLRRRGEAFTVFMLDLDRFKDVNDSLGHPAGDALLMDTAKRLKSALHGSHVLARLGGDEFAIIQTDETDQREAATALANRLIEIITEPYDIDGNNVTVGTSIGIALAPADGVDPTELLKRADMALYRAKSEGRNGYCFFDPQMTTDADARHRLENDLRGAILRDEVVIHYQPIIDVNTRKPSGMEALVRWCHPTKGVIFPDQFIPLAEDTGLIVLLGERVLQKACADAATWPSHIKVAVNLSPVQFRKGKVLDVILCALVESGLPPERLELEITETVLLDNGADHLAILHQLKNLGVSMALDDFGTGYSSLSYLTMFPFDKIKIDKSFTQNLTKRADYAAIVSSVLNLAGSLDVATVAEGVETEQQFELLRSTGVNFVQGHLFGRPRPASEVDFNRVCSDGDVERAA